MHHANLIVNKENSKSLIFDILEKDFNFKTKANPDLLVLEFESFGVDEARDLGKWAIGKPICSEIKISLVLTKSMTVEAQNAMLKILEEPPLGTYFFISVENLGGILPTLLSRVAIIGEQNKIGERNNNTFLNSDINERLNFIKKISKKENKSEMKNFIKNLEEIAWRENSKPETLKNILTAKVLTSARGSSPKMILEWLSCVLPSSEF